MIARKVPTKSTKKNAPRYEIVNRAITDEDDALAFIKEIGGVEGNTYIPRSVRGVESGEEVTESMKLIFARERFGQSQAIERIRTNRTTKQLAEAALEGTEKSLVANADEIVTYYGGQAIKMRARDDLEYGLRKAWLRSAQEKVKGGKEVIESQKKLGKSPEKINPSTEKEYEDLKHKGEID